MKKIKPIGFALICSATMLFATPSNATIFAYASIGEIGYQLYDLDDQDGINPSISFLGNLINKNENYVRIQSKDGIQTESSLGGLVSVVSSQAAATASRVTSNWNSGLVSTATAITATTPVITDASAQAKSTFSFELGAGTGVTFTTLATSQASLATPTDRAVIAYSFGVTCTSHCINAQVPRNFESFATGVLPPQSHTISLAIGHFGNARSTYTAEVGTWANVISSIPEAETYALMLAGLALIGTIARRRKVKQA
jgi:hypothetical protein